MDCGPVPRPAEAMNCETVEGISASLHEVNIDSKPASAEPRQPAPPSATAEKEPTPLEKYPKIPELSEIRNIAYYATPPTQTTTRTTPLTDRLKRTDPFQFGSRYLEENDDVFSWNAWDHVDPSKDEVFVNYAAAQYAFQREHAASDFDRRRFNADPEKWWNKFYGNNAANFFKDRKWLRQEFPVLGTATGITHDELRGILGAKTSEGDVTAAAEAEGLKVEPKPWEVEGGPWNVILEVGAGAGNTAFPLVRDNHNPYLFVHACDFSAKAVQVMQKSELYNPKHMLGSQWDLAGKKLPERIQPGSVDVVVLIFVLSALSPKQWKQAMKNIWTVLRPGGEVCFRDYGRGDLAQVRFKKGRLIGENFYVRGDGTRVYFFEDEQLKAIFGGKVSEAAKEALWSEDEEQSAQPSSEVPNQDNGDEDPQFEILSLATDRRLLVNRQKQLKMYRCWQQGRFRKPGVASKI